MRNGSAFPLSFSQQRLWFFDQLEPGTIAFNLAGGLRLIGPFDAGAFHAAIAAIARRHEVLRTVFRSDRGTPSQIVLDDCELSIPLVDLAGLPEPARHRESMRIARAFAREQFDLTRGPLFRLLLLRLADREHLVVVSIHHIVSDAWSLGIIGREISAHYAGLVVGRAPDASPATTQFRQFAQWQRLQFHTGELAPQIGYWRRQLEDVTTGDSPVAGAHGTSGASGATSVFSFASDMLRRITEAARMNECTIFMVLLAALDALVVIRDGEEDVIVGTGTAGRKSVATEGAVGPYGNLLVLRADCTGDPTFAELLARIKHVVVSASANDDVPFDVLVDELGIQRGSTGTPLLRTVLVLLDDHASALTLPGIEITPVAIDNGVARFDLTFFAVIAGSDLELTVQYSTERFTAEEIRNLVADYETLLENALADPDRRITELSARICNRSVDQSGAPSAEFPAFDELRPKRFLLESSAGVRATEICHGGTRVRVFQSEERNDLAEWAGENRNRVLAEAHEFGAVLFRGFHVSTVGRFEDALDAMSESLCEENGELPRSQLSDRIYTSVDYPPGERILWHSENTFLPEWPGRIWFACLEAAKQGGETPIVDNRQVFARLRPESRQRFIERGVLYERNFGLGVGVDWQAAFQTTSRELVENRCRKLGMGFEWHEDGGFRTRIRRPAVMRHPVTGETVWFAQLTHWHPSCLPSRIKGLMPAVFGHSALPRNVYYGDGSEIGADVMHELCEVYARTELVFPWQTGDVMMLDNLLCAHARNRFRGSRRIIVALAEMRGDLAMSA